MDAARRRISLQDIATEAGVTVSTVSRILSQQTEGFSVKPAVRNRVLQAAERLKYRPNILAQSLRKEKMSIIGLLAVQPELVYIQTLIEGLLKVLEPQKVALCSTYSLTPHPLQTVPPWRIDGAVVVSSVSAEETAELERSDISYVVVNGIGGPSASTVNMDDVGGTRQVVEYLVRLGHRRIAYANVGGPYQQHISVGQRHRAYLDVLAEAGCSPLPMHDVVLPEVADEFVQNVVLRHKPTAIVCYHTLQALSLLKSLQIHGLRVPYHVSLVALSGGFPLAELYPSISALSLPFKEAGEIAAYKLFEMFEKPNIKPTHVTLPEKLIVRESTAPPPAEH